MTKKDLVDQISANTGIEKAVIMAVVEEFMTTTKKSLQGGDNVYLRGFGSFTLKRRAEKVGRNITKGTSLVIPEHSIPAFKPAKEFKLDVKENN